jgi:ribosomal protein L34
MQEVQPIAWRRQMSRFVDQCGPWMPAFTANGAEVSDAHPSPVSTYAFATRSAGYAPRMPSQYDRYVRNRRAKGRVKLVWSVQCAQWRAQRATTALQNFFMR